MAANHWLQADRLDAYNAEDFPDLASEEKAKVPAIIGEFNQLALRREELSTEELAIAKELLISLITIFAASLADTHGAPVADSDA